MCSQKESGAFLSYQRAHRGACSCYQLVGVFAVAPAENIPNMSKSLRSPCPQVRRACESSKNINTESSCNRRGDRDFQPHTHTLLVYCSTKPMAPHRSCRAFEDADPSPLDGGVDFVHQLLLDIVGLERERDFRFFAESYTTAHTATGTVTGHPLTGSSTVAVTVVVWRRSEANSKLGL